MTSMRIGIDLLWVRPGKNGGTESYIRNMLDGFSESSAGYTYFLFVSRTNADSFNAYQNVKSFNIIKCNVNSESQKERVIWQNLHLDKAGIGHKLDLWFIPIYSIPFIQSHKVPYVAVIHDVQAKHYPQYFSFSQRVYFNMSWRNTCRTASRIVTISEFCKDDILKFYPGCKDRINVIYNPVVTGEREQLTTDPRVKFGIGNSEFYFTLSALAQHKNIATLLRMMEIIMEEKVNNCKLIVTGVRVNAANEIMSYVKSHHLEDRVIFTGFISNAERNWLYDNCKVFLFPSVFEGFGLPPVEALQRGIPVITTMRASIYEVTQGKAKYVNNPFDEKEWLKMVKAVESDTSSPVMFEDYSLERVVNQYEDLFEQVVTEHSNA